MKKSPFLNFYKVIILLNLLLNMINIICSFYGIGMSQGILNYNLVLLLIAIIKEIIIYIVLLMVGRVYEKVTNNDTHCNN